MEKNKKPPEINQEGGLPKKTKKNFFERRSSWLIMGFVLVILVLVLATVGGAARGINDRVSLAETQAAPRVQSQLESARTDIEEGRYDIALSRLDWILDEMSTFISESVLAEVGQLYSQTLLLISSNNRPTPQPSVTPTEPAFTPTPDLRGVEEMYDSAMLHITNGEWEQALQTIQALREKDITFRTVRVDGMLYVALRNRGLQKILAEGSLEPGIYDLTLAEQFAPLDSRAEGLRTWARFYLTGSSYWGVDWAQVVYYFEQVYPHLPNLRDGTFMTATERFRIGSIEYGTQLAAAGDFCLAQEYFDRAMAIADDPVARPTAQWVAETCWEELNPPVPPEPEAPTTTPTPTLTPQGEEPTPSPTEDAGEGE